MDLPDLSAFAVVEFSVEEAQSAAEIFVADHAFEVLKE